jgi:SAM-dependent methyltransferase
MIKLNLGCGDQVVDGWVNVDYALGARMAANPVLGPLARRLRLFRMQWNPRIRIHDLTRPLPWPVSSVDVCYSSHTVEHMTRDEGARLVSEAFRVLKPGGVLRVVVPDLQSVIQHYHSGRLAADHFVEELGVLYGPGAVGIRKLLVPLVQFPHKCMYDTATMTRLLQSSGFEARPCAAFDSAIDDIRAIEIEDRTDDAVIVEGIKPARA